MTGVVPAEGEAAVRLARRALELCIAEPELGDVSSRLSDESLPSRFDRPGGVFVTLAEYPSGELRGCIGFPRAVYPLRVAIPRAAQAAGTEDPRFLPLRPSDLSRVTVEVSLLTDPEPIPRPKDDSWVESVRVGTDGLIVEGYGQSGLLLPQVATEQGWNAGQFLSETCRKAGLEGSAWRAAAVRVYRFQAGIFGESTPRGPIESHAPTVTRRAGRSEHRP
ncbi:MAG: TIGR00296 family protein [Thermoplasmata archaeon]